MTPRPIDLSVVIPFFNEEPNIAALMDSLRATLEPLCILHEVIAVDDGSRDGTAGALRTVARDWPALRIVELPANRGQAAALWAGFAATSGTWIATLDGDGQNPPTELPRLWIQRDTADLLNGRRAHRQDSLLRRAMSRIANGVRRRLLRDGVHDSGCALRLFRREVLGSLLPIRTLYSFIPAMAATHGWKIREIDVAHHPRRAGTSKYGLRAMALHPFCDTLALYWLLRRRLPRG